ncbi:MAG: hypothetical protein AAF195_00025 [Pseudomonadota bacterium]
MECYNIDDSGSDSGSGSGSDDGIDYTFTYVIRDLKDAFDELQELDKDTAKTVKAAEILLVDLYNQYKENPSSEIKEHLKAKKEEIQNLIYDICGYYTNRNAGVTDIDANSLTSRKSSFDDKLKEADKTLVQLNNEIENKNALIKNYQQLEDSITKDPNRNESSNQLITDIQQDIKELKLEMELETKCYEIISKILSPLTKDKKLKQLKHITDSKISKLKQLSDILTDTKKTDYLLRYNSPRLKLANTALEQDPDAKLNPNAKLNLFAELNIEYSSCWHSLYKAPENANKLSQSLWQSLTDAFKFSDPDKDYTIGHMYDTIGDMYNTIGDMLGCNSTDKDSKESQVTEEKTNGADIHKNEEVETTTCCACLPTQSIISAKTKEKWNNYFFPPDNSPTTRQDATTQPSI